MPTYTNRGAAGMDAAQMEEEKKKRKASIAEEIAGTPGRMREDIETIKAIPGKVAGGIGELVSNVKTGYEVIGGKAKELAGKVPGVENIKETVGRAGEEFAEGNIASGIGEVIGGAGRQPLESVKDVKTGIVDPYVRGVVKPTVEFLGEVGGAALGISERQPDQVEQSSSDIVSEEAPRTRTFGKAPVGENYIKNEETGEIFTEADLKGRYSRGDVGLSGQGSYSKIGVPEGTPERGRGIGRKIEQSDYIKGTDAGPSYRERLFAGEKKTEAESDPGFYESKYTGSDPKRKAQEANRSRDSRVAAITRSNIRAKDAQAQKAERTGYGINDPQRLAALTKQAETSAQTGAAKAAESSERTRGQEIVNNLRNQLSTARTPEEKGRITEQIAAAEGRVIKPEQEKVYTEKLYDEYGGVTQEIASTIKGGQRTNIPSSPEYLQAKRKQTMDQWTPDQQAEYQQIIQQAQAGRWNKSKQVEALKKAGLI